MSAKTAPVPGDPDRALATSQAAQALGDQGDLARHLPQVFRVRPGQQRMALAVERALTSGRHLIVEAGTGIGKTFAYLVPVILSGKKVLISTATRALQDQLFQRDLPLLCEALGRNPKVALLKGRGNYLCLHRFARALTKGGRTREEGEWLGELDAWRHDNTSGDLAECACLAENSSLRPRVTSTSENCLGSRCPRFAECFVVKARRRAQEAQIIVINHHLLLADFRLREGDFGELLPHPQAVIVDEAHALGEVAFQAFGEQVSSFQIAAMLSDLEDATDLAAEATLRSALDEPRASLEGAFAAAREGFAELAKDQGVRAQLPHDVSESLRGLVEALKDLGAALERLAEAEPELSRLAERARELAERTAAWLQGEASAREEASGKAQGGSDRCAWYQRTSGGFRLHSAPTTVAEPLKAWRAGLGVPWVLTSATLTVAGSFEHLKREWGLQDAATLRIESPFAYEENARLYVVPRDWPKPRERDIERHRSRLLELAKRLFAASRGRAFLLCTSHDALDWFETAFEAERQRGAFPWPLLVQGQRSHQQLLEAFRKQKDAVLLGTASFWQGVDVPGQALSLVIIDKLPFRRPDDPLHEARARAVTERGGDAFRHLAVPEAVMALKQGAGRLIRSETDQGVLVIADPRLHTNDVYGADFLDSLPPMRQVASEAEVLAFLRSIP